MNFILVLKIFALLSTFSLGNEFQSCLPSSCAELIYQGNRISGIYTIYPRKWFKQTPFQVYCDMETDGGGWTVIQRRDDFVFEDGTHENFFRNWTDYKTGFGDLQKEFWLGNDFIYILTNQDRVSLRVELQDFEGNSGAADYKYFHITDEISHYTLTVSGFHGIIGDSLAHHNGQGFVTYDANDVKNVAKTYKGAWWYSTTYYSHLNGLYVKSRDVNTSSVNWYNWYGKHIPLKRAEMKLRPVLAYYYNNCHFKGCPQTSCEKNPNLDFEQKLQLSKQDKPLPLK